MFSLLTPDVIHVIHPRDLLRQWVPRPIAALYRLPIPERSLFTVVSVAREQPWQWVTPSMLYNRTTQTVSGNETGNLSQRDLMRW